MKQIVIVTALWIVICLHASSCRNGVDCDRGFAGQLQSESSTLQAAFAFYNANQTVESCEAYVRALDKYIEAVRPFRECATSGQEQDEFDVALLGLEKSRDDINCM